MWADSNDKGHSESVEGLGDAVMTTMHPDPDQHEWMGPGMMSRWGMTGNPRVPYESYSNESPEDIVKRR